MVSKISSMSVDLTKLGACVVKRVTDQRTVTVNSFWEGSPCVITLFRRFGCQFCRFEALELSRLQPALKTKGVRLIGIGFDSENLEDFENGNFFSGELFLDEEKVTYSALQFERTSVLSGMLSLFRPGGLRLIRETRSKNVEGNTKGDGWQLGGLIAIDKDGKVVYSFKQDRVSDNPDYEKIREIFGVSAQEVAPLRGDEPKQCN